MEKINTTMHFNEEFRSASTKNDTIRTSLMRKYRCFLVEFAIYIAKYINIPFHLTQRR
ncbi:Uncharacterised protein [Myroides odoratus]|nr:hypothetical protein Myrod_2633 [Myroides odoratus DSM 2801]EKB06121.1 hypothetical protein HMPREF9716_02497 [Myroides odoratus CIP 103059]STZ30733.1 Uncharacterised protein [Myroides odoratus]